MNILSFGLCVTAEAASSAARRLARWYR